VILEQSRPEKSVFAIAEYLTVTEKFIIKYHEKRNLSKLISKKEYE